MSVEEKKAVVEGEIETQEELIAQIQNVLLTKSSVSIGGDVWTRFADISTEADTGYVEWAAPEGKHFKHLRVMVATNVNGLSGTSKLSLRLSQNGVYNSNYHYGATTPGNTGTYAYPIFDIDLSSDIQIAAVSNGAINGANAAATYWGGAWQSSPAGQYPAMTRNFKYARLHPTASGVTFNENCLIRAEAVFADD